MGNVYTVMAVEVNLVPYLVDGAESPEDAVDRLINNPAGYLIDGDEMSLGFIGGKWDVVGVVNESEDSVVWVANEELVLADVAYFEDDD